MIRNPDLLQKHLDYRFNDATLLEQALTHRSAGSRNNERLEFLGDAILGGVVAGDLYQRFPGAKEGRLSRLRASLVRRESLADIAQSLQIGDYLQLGAGERKSGGHHRDSIMSDALEALLGAIYLDGGYAPCRECILGLFAGKLESLADTTVLKDSKTRLQEFLQAQHKALPAYSVVLVSGEAHAQAFRIECSVAGVEPSMGEGGSRRQAEQDAAERMIEQLAPD